jgi:hypothetical protein
MDRRQFFQLTPLAAVATTGTLTITEPGKDPVGPLDLSVLRLQRGDVIVITTPHGVSSDTASRIKAYVEGALQPLGVTAWVMGDGLTVAGVLRGTP